MDETTKYSSVPWLKGSSSKTELRDPVVMRIEIISILLVIESWKRRIRHRR